jgi:glutathione S-transferase
MKKLHCFCQSGNAYKVALAMEFMNVPWQPVFVDFMNGQTRDTAWRDGVNPMGEVPVMEDNGRVITQSTVMLRMLARETGLFGARDGDEDDELLRWMLFDNHKFTANFATYRFMKSFGPSAPDPAVMKFMRSRVDAAYGIVNKHLSTRAFMVGERLTIADLSLCGYVFYPPEECGFDIRETHPNIFAWRERIRAQPRWQDPYDLMPGERIAPKW